MPATPASLTPEIFWQALGVTGAIIFYGRFYAQWIASEIKRRSVIPIVFWYMSSVGSLMLLAYGVYTQSPLGTLSQSLNIVIYSRNLIHIWRERGRLSQRRNVIVHVAVACIAVVAVILVGVTWLNEYQREMSPEQAMANWFWLGIGVAGQGLFACRFLIQWAVTEYKRKSVVPPVFWHLSVVAAAMQLACYAQRAEWIYAAGVGATILIYVRNIWFIHGVQAPSETPGEDAQQAPGAGSSET